MKGTITWLPIEDAPKEMGYYLGCNIFNEQYQVIFWSETISGWSDSKGEFEPTHYALINPPEVSE